MTFDFLDRRSAERFAELLDETTAGRRHHARGQADEHLAELVAIGHSLSAARPAAQVDPEFRMGLRAMLVATAERDGIGASAQPTDDPSEAAVPARKLLGRTGKRLRARGAIIIGVAAGAMAVSGISAASENASPGDALYGVKRSTERAQLAMAGSDITRGQLSLTFARNRLTEAVAMNGGNAKFGDALDDMDADTKEGVKLLTSAAVVRKDAAGLVSVDSFVDGQRRLLTPALEQLDGSNRVRALASMSLLDNVERRAENVRNGLSCDASQDDPDALGPKLKSCTTGVAETPAEDRQQGQTSAPGKLKTKDDKDSGVNGQTKKSVQPKTSDEPTAEPDPTRTSTSKGKGKGTGTGSDDGEATGSGLAPDATEPPVTATLDPEPTISDDPANPSTAEDKGLLGGLLGNLFGSGEK
ncbi:DUF5667 domain-containing protein [Actinoplanes sp. TFC3]|uniref:DUF5667 domain-containing protein n=1 Tax=Actinoplanes sp. TFC3 TaxID=1710355 RepID=UPI000ADBE6EF|nr:DUF5667 domain-containing protein [Actinoplanes sp. TFC3]